MYDIWKGQFLRFALLALAALGVALPFGWATGFALFGGGVLAIHAMHLARLAALARWLSEPNALPVPESGGAWAEVTALLRRFARRTRSDQDLLREALERSRLVGAALPDGVVILDETDRIEWCNPAAERHFGIDLGRDRGQQIVYLVRQPDFVEFTKRRSGVREISLRHLNNGDLSFALRMIPFGRNGQLLVSRDITHEETSERIRRDFVANVSHELRTPITVVSGFLETLSDMEEVNPKVLSRSIELMRDQATRMQRLVEDLLVLSRLESNEHIPRDDDVDAAGMARKVAREAEHLSRGQHRISARIEARDHVQGNENELHSAFGNLVSNAVRYTKTDGAIEVRWFRDGDSGVFEVRDSGIGIAPEHLPRITERFYRVDRGRSRETGGTGLGLAIVKHVCQRHGATLEVDSVPGVGSRFRVRFPSDRLIAAPESETIGLNYDERVE
jgi:two-component system, OmpR family, phosphate regulon sensor histidine kinase PhoR